MRYLIKHEGKEYTHIGETALQALGKFSNHRMFGSGGFNECKAMGFCVESGGRNWAEAIVGGYRVLAVKV